MLPSLLDGLPLLDLMTDVEYVSSDEEMAWLLQKLWP